MLLSDVLFGSAVHLVSNVGHNIKRQAGFPFQQARVLKMELRQEKNRVERRLESDGKGMVYQKIIRFVD